MTWTTPRTWVTGEIVTAAELNTHVRDDLSYLHGDAGPVTLGSPILATQGAGIFSTLGQDVSGASGGNTYAGMFYDVANELVIEALTAGVAWRNVHLAKGGGLVKANGRVVQTRGDGAIGHEESGRVTVATGVAVAVTFADAFASTPAVFANCENSNPATQANAYSPSTTGVTLKTTSGSTETVSWSANGQD